MRGEQGFKSGVLVQRAAQQFGEQFLVVTAKILFGQNLLFDLRLIARGDAPLVNTMQDQFARAMARASVWRFLNSVAGNRVAHARSCSRLAISMATSAASPPLTCMRSMACSSVSVVRIALATGTPQDNWISFMQRADSFDTTSKW